MSLWDWAHSSPSVAEGQGADDVVVVVEDDVDVVNEVELHGG